MKLYGAIDLHSSNNVTVPREIKRIKQTFSWNITSPLRVLWNLKIKVFSRIKGFFSDGHGRQGFKSGTIQQNRLLPGIHGLRGVATLSVVLYHLVHLAHIAVPHFFAFISSEFGKGVHLFFVLSAFSLMYSTEFTMVRPTWASEYFVKRFFRIAPLFYCILATMVVWPLIKYHTLLVDFPTLLMNFTFTFGLAPWTGIVWGGWTVGVEMMFYVVLPVILLTVRTRFGALILVLVSVFATYAARSVLQVHFEPTVAKYGYNWSYFSFAANLCFFAMGIYAFRLERTLNKSSVLIRWILPTLTLVLLSLLMQSNYENQLNKLWKGDLILWGVCFTLLTIWQSLRPSLWSANFIFEYLGERSYSLYLVHPIMIVLLKDPIKMTYDALLPYLGPYAFFICALLMMVPLCLVSEATYRLIEVPGIQFGRKLVTRMQEKQGAL